MLGRGTPPGWSPGGPQCPFPPLRAPRSLPTGEHFSSLRWQLLFPQPQDISHTRMSPQGRVPTSICGSFLLTRHGYWARLGACPGCPRSLRGPGPVLGARSPLHLPSLRGLASYPDPAHGDCTQRAPGHPRWLTALLPMPHPWGGHSCALACLGAPGGSPWGQTLHLLPELHPRSQPGLPAHSEPTPPAEE